MSLQINSSQNRVTHILKPTFNICTKLILALTLFSQLSIVKCQFPFPQFSYNFVFCQKTYYVDPNTYSCKSCQNDCYSCFRSDLCQVCTYGNLNEETCLSKERICQSGYKFNEVKKQCTKCKVDFCTQCDINDVCSQCKEGFELVNNFSCQKKIHQAQDLVSCPVGSDENNGSCFQNPVCSSQIIQPVQAEQEEAIQILEIKMSNDILFVFKKSIKSYRYDDLSYNSEIIRLLESNDEINLTIHATKNYLMVQTNYYVYLFSLPSYQYLNKKSNNLDGLEIQENEQFIFTSLESDNYFVVSYAKEKASLRIISMNEIIESNFFNIQSEVIAFSNNTQLINTFVFIYDLKIIIATNYKTFLLLNLNFPTSDSQSLQSPFILKSQISDESQITYRVEKNVLNVFVSKQNESLVLKVLYDIEKNSIIEQQAKEVTWDGDQILKGYTILLNKRQIQQQKLGIYFVQQIYYQISTQYQPKLFFGIIDVENIFSKLNNFYYQQFDFIPQPILPINPYFIEDLINNKLIIILTISGQIKFLSMTSNSKDLPSENELNFFYNGFNNNYVPKFQVSTINTQNLIIQIGEYVKILTIKDKLSESSISKQNVIPTSFFNREKVYQIIVLSDLQRQQNGRNTFVLLNYKSIGQFEVLQIRENQRGDQEVVSKRSIQFQEQEQLNQLINEDSFFSEEEQLIYMITKKGIYIINYYLLNVLKYIPVYTYIIREGSMLMIESIQIISDTTISQIQIVELLNSNLNLKFELESFKQYQYNGFVEKHKILINPYNSQMYFIRYSDNGNTSKYRLFIDNQEVQLFYQTDIYEFNFFSETEVGYIQKEQYTTFMKLALEKNAKGNWSIVGIQMFPNENELDCKLIKQTKSLSYCHLINQQYPFMSILFDWQNMSLKSNTPNPTDNYEYLQQNIDGNYNIESIFFDDMTSKIIVNLKEVQTNVESQYSLQLLIYLDPTELIMYQVDDDFYKYFYIDNQSQLKTIPNQNFYIQRNPNIQSHIRVIFQSFSLYSALFAIQDNFGQDNFTYWKQKRQIIYQDNGKALSIKEIGNLNIHQNIKTNFRQFIGISDNLGMVIFLAETQILFLSLDLQQIQYSIQFQTSDQPYNLFWSEKYVTLVYLDNDDTKIYKIANSSEIPGKSLGRIKEKFNQFDCQLMSINPFLVCHNYGILNFETGEKHKNLDLVISAYYRLYKVTLLENESFFLSIFYHLTYTVYQFDIIKKKFTQFQLFLGSQPGLFLSFFLPPGFINQMIYISKDFLSDKCGVIQFETQSIIQNFENNEYTQKECLYFQNQYFSIRSQNLLTVYKLPILPNDAPFFKHALPSFYQISFQILINDIFYVFNKIDSFDNSQLVNVYSINIITGVEHSKMSFFRKDFEKSGVQLWEEKNLFIFNDYLYSLGSTNYVWQYRLFSEVAGYSYRYNYIIFFRQHSEQQGRQFTSLDISEVFPFSSEQNDFFNSLDFQNQIIYSRGTNDQVLDDNYFIYFNQQDFKILKFYLSNEINNQQTLLDLNDNKQTVSFLKDINKDQYKTSYKVVELKDRTTNNLLFGIQIFCKLIFFENQALINQIDLLNFDCQIITLQNQLFIVDQKKQVIIELIYNEGNITQQETAIDVPNPDFIISDIYSSNSGNWLLIFLRNKNDQQQNVIKILRYDNGNYNSIKAQVPPNVQAHLFLQLYKEQYLLLASQGITFTFQLSDSLDNPDRIFSFLINFFHKKQENIIFLTFGQIFNFKEMLIEQENQVSIKINIFVSAKNRIIQLQGTYSKDLKDFEVLLNLKNSQQIHTRKNHLLKILGDSYIAILSDMQVSIYSLTLQYICRIEEFSFSSLNDIFIAPDKMTVLVTDVKAIYSFRINLINSRERLILQQQFSYENPIIYEVSQIPGNQDMFSIYGVSANQVIKINYSLKINTNLDQPSNCIRYLSALDSIDEQMKQYTQIFQSMNPQNQIIRVALSLSKSSTILLPYFKKDQYKVFYTSQKYFYIEIDIQKNNLVDLYQNFIQQENIIKSLKLTNGKFAINEKLYFQNMEEVILSNIELIYNSKYSQILFTNVKKITFDNVVIRSQYFDQNSSLKENSYLFQIQNSDNIVLNLINIENVKFKSRGLFSIEQSQLVTISQLNFKLSTFEYAYSLLNFIDNKSVNFDRIQIIDSSFHSFMNFKNNLDIVINDFLMSNFIQSKNPLNRILSQNKARQLQQNQNILEGDAEKESLIKIRYTQNSVKINKIDIGNNSNLSTFLFSTNELVNQYYQANSQDEIEAILTEISLQSKLEITGVKVSQTHFQQIFALVKENNILFDQLEIIDSQNCQFYLSNAIQQLKLQKIKFNNNILQNSPLFKIENSNVFIDDVSINKINIEDKIDQEQSIFSLIQSNFLIDKLITEENKSVNYFLIATDQFIAQQSNLLQNKVVNSQKIINSHIQLTTGGAFLIQNIESLEIVDTIIEKNRSKDNGGGVCLINVMSSLFKNVKLLDNQAHSSGGGVYLEQSNLKLQDSLIQYNKAQIGGGIRYNNTSIFPEFISQNIAQQIKDNSAAIFGDNYCSFPSKIEMIEIDSEEYSRIQQDSTEKDVINNYNNAVSSVNQQSTLFVFKLLDENSQIVKLPKEKPIGTKLSKIQQEIVDYYEFNLQFNEDNNKVIIQNKNVTNIYIDAPYYHFAFIKYLTHTGYSSILKNEKPQNEEILMNIVSKSQQIIPNYQNKQLMQVSQLKTELSLKFRMCLEGEIIINSSENYYICEKCQGNTYSLQDPYQLQNNPNYGCKDCPNGATFCEGSEIKSIDGYWHEQNSDNMFFCINSQNACSTSEDSKLGCKEGYFGPLCESCDYDSQVWGRDELTGDIVKQYAKKGKFKCTECNDKISQQNQYSLSIFIAIMFIVYLCYQINNNYQSKKNKLKAIQLKKLGILFVSNSLDQKDKTSVLIKIIINYMQLVMIVNSFIVNTPNWLKVTLALGNVLDSTMYSLDCLFVKSQLYQSIPIVYLRLLWTLLQPILYMIVLFLGLIIFTKLQGQKLVQKRNFIISALLKIYFMVFPSIIQQTIGNISCRLINGNYLILNDLQFECFDSNYFLYNVVIGIPYSIIVILTPYLILRILRAHSKKLYTDFNVFLRYGFFFTEYKQSYFYWEIVRMYQKILTYMIIGFLNQENLISSLFLSIIIILYMMAQIKNKPFKYNEFNKIDLLSQITALLTILGMTINTQSSNDALTSISLIVVAISNIYFVIRIVRCVFQNVLPVHLIEKIFTLKQALNKLLPKIISPPSKFKVNLINVTKNWKKIKQLIENRSIYKDIKYSNFSRVNINNLLKTNQNLDDNEKNHLLKVKQSKNTEQTTPQEQEIISQGMLSNFNLENDQSENGSKTDNFTNRIKQSQFNTNRLSQLGDSQKVNQ